MKVKNMTNGRGNKVANQFIIEVDDWNYISETHKVTHYNDIIVFQSYYSVIAIKAGEEIYLDKETWDYSTTTSKYRNIFLGETTKETLKKIKSGEYILTNLN